MERRAKIWLLVRTVASVAMLAVLVSRVELASLLPEVSARALAWLGGGLVVTVVAALLAALRWKWVLGAFDVDCGFGSLLSHSLAGQFVSNFLPSSVGGDVLRAARLSQRDDVSGATAFASVLLERLSGIVALPVITLVALAANPALVGLGWPGRLALAVSLATLVGLVCLLSVLASPRLAGRLADGSRWLRLAAAVTSGVSRLRARPRMAASILATAAAYQMAIVAASWAGAQALGLDVGWTAIMAFVPVVAIAQILPLSLNGIGVREGAFVVLLAPLGVASGQAVVFGLLLYAMNLAVSVLGAPAFALGARVPAGVTPSPALVRT
ncbi:MAG: lysylphosphatidylglycerol synthase transmembrane domain-containing protein [Acidimicrobiales bacterium]